MEAKIRGLMIQLRRRKLIDEMNGSRCAFNLNRRWDRGFKRQGANNIKKILLLNHRDFDASRELIFNEANIFLKAVNTSNWF